MLESLPWFESGKPLKNWMLHETDFYDEVEQIWGRRWGAEGIGTLREVLVSRPSENEIRPEYAEEWQYYYSSAAGNADLGRLQAQYDAYYQTLEDHGVRVNYIEPPVPAIGAYGYIKNLVTLAGGGLVVRGGALLHRYGLGSWQRGREVIWEQVLAALQVPIYLTFHGKAICEPGAGRWLDSKTFVFNESVVANEEGLRQLEFVLANLGIELIVCHSPGWYDSIGNGNIGTSHMDMVMLTVDHGKVLLAPASRELRVRPGAAPPRLHDHRGARRGVLGPRDQRRHPLAREGRGERRLADGREGARAERRRGDPGRLLGEPPLRDRRTALRDPRAPARPGLARRLPTRRPWSSETTAVRFARTPGNVTGIRCTGDLGIAQDPLYSSPTLR